ncbi:CPBP family intramembrane glutamic endopeptidase [Blastococcus sp. CT_GayMR16]|uniref:CPBP family intramembrane glutamic endopeptidase n=1 Tax=Blastococcus sp. CT_GayMR16 TaxID=2559607 RepID=UPI0010747089|nr:CPBP family intramembrane glutamic endopeptidase [Blastococcus sp. CT_GayMR16]TFV86999.1 CPBP family intramembrane metalloprotease [Blastococcus sp. CT_GayMR16]
MQGRPVRRWAPVGLTGALVAVLGVWNNLVVTRLPGYPASYVVVNVAATGVLLAAARAAGLTWDELGLDRRRVPAGLRWGGTCAGLVTAGFAVAVAIPALRPLLTDARISDLDGAELSYQALVRVPFGTVVWEEVAFRGVLLAAFTRLLPVPAATAASSAVFGIWHIRPTLSALAANDLVEGPGATTLAVLLACAGTAAAGVGFTWLRLRSASLLAPVLLHVATNSVGSLAAAAAARLA